jgi:hypothetical protein
VPLVVARQNRQRRVPMPRWRDFEAPANLDDTLVGLIDSWFRRAHGTTVAFHDYRRLPRTFFWRAILARATGGMTEVERIAHYRELAAQFREWAEDEANQEARLGLLDMARQYDRLAGQ